MEIYHKMGFKMYLHYVSNDFILDKKWDIVTDLTGYYVLMDPASFTNREMDGHDQLIDSKYMSIISVARGIGFLHYYRMNANDGHIEFLTDYDSYVYTPHKSIFYVLPKGFLSDYPGHQNLFMKEKSVYLQFVLGVNTIRNYAISINTNGICDSENGYIQFLLNGLLKNGIITETRAAFLTKAYGFFKEYFNFPMQSYNCLVSGLLSHDDRRYIDDTEVEKMFMNERSISTLSKLNSYEVLFKRGYYFVRKNEKEVNDSKLNSEYRNYQWKRRYEHSVTEYKDKFIDRGPESNYDKRSWSDKVSRFKMGEQHVKKHKNGVKKKDKNSGSRILSRDEPKSYRVKV